MFTGIITGLGTVLERRATDEELELLIQTPYAADDIQLGESIACAGVCLTVMTCEARAEGAAIWVHLSNETLMHSAPHHWEIDATINLERALRAQDRLGGHFVTGHSDGTVKLSDKIRDGESTQLTLQAPEKLAQFIAPKGSVTLDGVSLTVNRVDQAEFCVTIIPHTWEHTSLHTLERGQKMNIEVDLLARYLARLNKQEDA